MNSCCSPEHKGPSSDASKTLSGWGHFAHFVPHSPGTVWCQVWSECQPLWSAGQKRPLLVSNRKHTLMEEDDGNEKTTRSSRPPWLYCTVWCQVWCESLTLPSAGENGLCCFLWTLCLICSLHLEHTFRSVTSTSLCCWTVFVWYLLGELLPKIMCISVINAIFLLALKCFFFQSYVLCGV